jgi:hypothetical protein
MRRALLLLIAIVAISAAPQNDNLVIEGRVLQKSSSAAVPDVLVLLGGGTEQMTSSAVSSKAAASVAQQIQSLRNQLAARVPDSTVQQSALGILKASGSGSSLSGYAFTDAAGRFSFKGLPPGHYTVRAFREGYFGPKVDGIYQPGFAKSIELEPNYPLISVDAFMTQGAIITGKVRTMTGSPSRTPVTVYRPIYTRGREKWASELTATTVQNSGDYTLRWVAPGEIYVGAMHTYYRDVTEPDLATRVIAREGETTVVDINVQERNPSLPRVSGAAVNVFAVANSRGVIDRSTPAFLVVERNNIIEEDPVALLNASPPTARVNGDFEVSTQPGRFELFGFVKDPTTGRSLIGRSLIDVPTSGLRGVSVPIQEGVTLTGQFIVAGAGAEQVHADSFAVRLESLGLLPKQFARELDPLIVEPTGFFGATHVPQEQYEVVVDHLPPAAYVQDIRTPQGGAFDNDGFYLDGATGTIQVIVRTEGQTVTGTVRSPDGIAADGATVVLIPPQQQRKNPIRYRVAKTDSNGHFAILNAAPGDYTVLAWESVLPTAWMNEKVIEKYERTGRRVSIAAGIPLDLQLSMIPDILPGR